MNRLRYLELLGISDTSGDKLELLKKIQGRHLEYVPFENFDIHMYGKLDISIDKLYEKIVLKHRGGICYELNYLLYNLLIELGYDVSILAGQVLEEGSEYDHLLLLVIIESERYLVDVGFGDNFFEPLRFECDIVQSDRKGHFRIMRSGEENYCLEHEIDNAFISAYRFSLKKREISEFLNRMNWFCQSDESLFTKRLFCSIEFDNGRISMRPGKMISTFDGSKTENQIANYEEFRKALDDKFHLEFNHAERLLRNIYERQSKLYN